MDDIGSFGSDFKGFPKHLPEDTVEYTLFIIGSSGQGSQDSRAELESVLAAACSLVQKLLQEYLWQREAFELESSHVDGMESSSVVCERHADRLQAISVCMARRTMVIRLKTNG